MARLGPSIGGYLLMDVFLSRFWLFMIGLDPILRLRAGISWYLS